MKENMYIPTMAEIKRFNKLTEYFTQPFAYHTVEGDAYRIAEKMYEGVMMHKQFLAYVNKDNSIEDIRKMYDELVESWTVGEFVIRKEDDDMYDYNLVNGNIGDIIKDDVFDCLVKEIR